MAFATYEDVEGRWRTLTADEQVRATTLLEDASTILSGMVEALQRFHHVGLHRHEQHGGEESRQEGTFVI